MEARVGRRQSHTHLTTTCTAPMLCLTALPVTSMVLQPPRASHRPGVTADRLNAAQPPPPSPAKAGVGKARERPNASGVPQVKRQNGVAGGLEATTPTASTQAQFQNSNVHLPGNRVNTPGNQAMTSQAQQPRRAPEPEPTFMQKIMKALCCGRFRVQNDS